MFPTIDARDTQSNIHGPVLIFRESLREKHIARLCVDLTREYRAHPVTNATQQHVRCVPIQEMDCLGSRIGIEILVNPRGGNIPGRKIIWLQPEVGQITFLSSSGPPSRTTLRRQKRKQDVDSGIILSLSSRLRVRTQFVAVLGAETWTLIEIKRFLECCKALSIFHHIVGFTRHFQARCRR